MTWTSPQCSEIKMDAEIGSYQEDPDDRKGPAFVAAEQEASHEELARAAE
jgi:hypothetical protein